MENVTRRWPMAMQPRARSGPGDSRAAVSESCPISNAVSQDCRSRPASGHVAALQVVVLPAALGLSARLRARVVSVVGRTNAPGNNPLTTPRAIRNLDGLGTSTHNYIEARRGDRPRQSPKPRQPSFAEPLPRGDKYPSG
eukprot:998721-Pleurochrysis_carterae.AAC.1